MNTFPEYDPKPSERAGVWTSEFWMSLACLACGMWLIARGKEELATWLVGIATGGYQGARAWTSAVQAKGVCPAQGAGDPKPSPRRGVP